jgi:hypothetical protein
MSQNISRSPLSIEPEVDWGKERPPQSDKERREKLEEKFEYAKPESDENLTSQIETQQKDEYIDKMKEQIDENARRDLPSVTQQRGPLGELDQQRMLNIQLEESLREEESEGLVPLKMQEAQSDRTTTEKAPFYEPSEPPKQLSTMDTERDSIVEKEMRWEKEHGLLPNEDLATQTSPSSITYGGENKRAPNPDITSESETQFAKRPSNEDYEAEKQSYSYQTHPQPQENEPQAPSDEQGLIEKLQTPEIDRDQPTAVRPCDPTLQQPPPQPSHLDLTPKQEDIQQQQLLRIESRNQPPINPAEDETLQTEFKSDFGRITSDLIEKQQQQSDVKKPSIPVEERATDAQRISREFAEKLNLNKLEKPSTEREELEPKNEILIPSTPSTPRSEQQEEEKEKFDLEKLDVQELISYLNKHKSKMSEILDEDDKKRIDVVLNVAKDIKTLCKEAVDTLKNDLQQFYNIGKSKWQEALTEINKLGPIEEYGASRATPSSSIDKPSNI